MLSTRTRRGAVAVVALLLATTPVAGAVGDGPLGTDESPGTGVTGDSAVAGATDERFASDVVAARMLGSPRARANATVTATGGHASAVGTDDVVTEAPLTISVTQRIALTPENPGEVRVTHVFVIPANVTSLETPLPERANVTSAVGFVPAGIGSYAWDGNTSRARITYTLSVNETVSQAGPEGARGRYLLVDAGRWALVRQPKLALSWRWQGPEPVGIEQETTTADAGYAGEQFVYLGAAETRERRAHGQTFTLVIPERATMTESPDAVLDALADASDRLRVGDRDEQVTVFVAPTTTTVQWGVRGMALGDSDAWVRDVEPLGQPDNTWLHEYVHTRQSFETAPSGRWLTEATATYYGALLTLERNETEFAAFREFLSRGARPPQSEAVLVEPRTWDNAADYWKGALVAAAVDRQIRIATNGTRSFGTVFSGLNAHPGPVDLRVTLDLVERAGGPAVDQFAGTYVTSSRVPPAWSAAEHEAAFGPTPAMFTVRFADRPGDIANATAGGNDTAAPDGTNATVGFRVTGPYRNGTVEGIPLTLYTGETLHATGVVENAGGATASYEQPFSVGGEVRRVVSGTLAPGETAVHPVNYTAETTGERAVSFGTDSVDVRVYEPAPARLGDVTVNRTTLQGPGVVAVTVTVVNPYDVPARRNVTVTRDDERVWSRQVAVPAGGNRTVSVPVRIDADGEHAVGVVDGPSTTVTVGEGDGAGTSDDRATATARDATDRSGPGVGAAGVLLALVLVVAALSRRLD